MIRVKVCGLTAQEDAQLASDLGAWALGFVFHAKSPRAISPDDAGALIQGLSSTSLKVGVFVDALPADVISTARIARLDAVQLHGSETPEYCAALKQAAPGLKLIKAFRLESESAPLPDFKRYSSCEWFLLDAYSKTDAGGTGKIAPWDLARKAAAAFPILLAGGLKEANIAAAVQAVRPFAVDLSSGLESSPGKKDAKKMNRFFGQLRRMG